MDDRFSRIEAQIRDLERSVATLARRVGALEAVPLPTPSPAPGAAADRDVLSLRDQAGAAIALVGRTFVALGGAYLLRALTDSGILPQRLGLALGIGYALVWLAAADRDGGRGRRLSAAFHALVGVLIAFPLLWEATVHFRDLSPAAGAAALAVITALATAVAVRHSLEPVAWIVLFAAIPTAITAISVTGAIVPFALYLIAFGVLTLWLGYSCEWVWLRWPAAFVADVTVLALTLSGAGRQPVSSPGAVVAVQMLLLNAYLASIAIRTIVRARDVIVFEMVQSPAALAVGFGGATYIASQTGYGVTLLALISLAFGVGCYAVGFAFMRQGRPRNFHFYSSFGIVLVLVSVSLLLAPPRLALLTTGLAIIATWAATRSGTTLVSHAIVYLLAAGVASGMVTASVSALAAPVSGSWVQFRPVDVIVVAGCAICWAIAPSAGLGELGAAASRVVLALLLILGAAGSLIALLGSFLPAVDGGPVDAGALATLRTAVLAVVAVALAWAGTGERFRESRWLFYPLLAAAGVKLVVEDLPRSRPQTLFIALAVYGLALIAAPRLSRRRSA